ncbi:MAG: Polysaccharide pyruvyl transferase [Firmicutes bacterium ADurb.Bin193]|nr:MAG: Polysaccharide pyruvyl transferase [Firmicutes bacterium ADurb.Bin193]
MKIGIITFHWATNYGAVLQAYALQAYLIGCGYDVKIINYLPLRVIIMQLYNVIRKLDFRWFVKEYNINKFRKQCLALSEKTFFTNKSLAKHCNNYDVYVCGSDQIWNEAFTLSAEGKPTLSYFLNFTSEDKRRISYAASFGTEVLSDRVVDLIKPQLSRFAKISVREKTGKSIIENMGFNAKLVVDPTLLLNRGNYDKLIENITVESRTKFFSYILHGNQSVVLKTEEYIQRKHFKDEPSYKKRPMGIFEWLYSVKGAEFVLTNSFHGVVFSLIFHTPFIVIPVENSDMNDRITTLLSLVGMENRQICEYDESRIDLLISEEIKWESVDNKIQELKKESVEFLKEALI